MARIDLLCLAALAALTPAVAQARSSASPTYALADRIAIPDGGFDFASFDPAHRRLYVSRVGGVTAVDVDTRTVTGKLTEAQRAHESLVLDDGAALLVTDGGANSAHIVNAFTGKSLAEIPTGQKPDAAILDSVTGLVLVMNAASGDVTLVDPIARKAVGAIAVGGGLEFPAVDGLGRAYVNIEDQSRIAVIDLKTRTVLTRYALNGCEGPTGLAYAAETGVLISACANKVAKVIRASDGADLATLPIGLGPDAVIYDADRKLAFIPCGRDGVLEVIAVRGPGDVAVVQTVVTQVGARTGALDPKTGRLYLPTAKYVLQPGARPAPQPGAFEILVVAPT